VNGNPLDEDNDNLLDEVVLDRICLDELNLMYLQWVQNVIMEELSVCVKA